MSMNRPMPCQPTGRPPQQQGVVLIVALIVLLAMTLAGIALMRSSTTGNRVAGNLAFQQSATQSADLGVEAAIAWLEANVAALNGNGAAGSPYTASRADPAAGSSWETFWADTVVAGGRFVRMGADPAGNSVSYAIHRLCNMAGNPITQPGIDCSASPASDAPGNSMGTSILPIKLPSQQYYRITARVAGPRNTVSFVQVMVAL